MTRKFLVLGANGQVGSALNQLLGERALPLTRKELPLDQPERLTETLNAVSAREDLCAVINAAAYTQVDRAEQEAEIADRVNGESPGIIARWCAGRQLPFVHYSTDYVFDGTGTRPWKEEDPTSPLNTYGRSKRAGEQAVQAAGGRYWIFRTSWVYDATGKNFVNTMIRLSADRSELRVVADQIGAPTYAPHLALATLEALKRHQDSPDFRSGIYHVANPGETSWHGFAEGIFEEARARGIPLAVNRVIPIPAAEYPTPAKRPSNSRMDLEKARTKLGISLPPWRQGLQACIDEIIRIRRSSSP